MKKKRIEELDILRSIAIMTVVTVHSITRVIEIHENHGMLDTYHEEALLTMRLFTTFGTPIFVFLSVFLLAYAYYDELPDNFMEKRIKLIIIPYISMSFIYAFIMLHESGTTNTGGTFISYFQYLFQNIFTGFYRHGYFILVIFQFYLIYIFFHDRLKKIKPAKLLLGAFLINLFYLGIFNFTNPNILPYGDKIWHGATWIIFPAWIFYFAIGYSSGCNIKKLNTWLNKYKKLILPSIFLFGSFMGYMYLSGNLPENSSKRFDMLLFSSSMFLLIYYTATKLKKTPALLEFINRYSFGIYLFHMIYLYLATYIFTKKIFFQIDPFLTLVLLISGSTVLSVITTYFLDKLSFGHYLIGRLEKPKAE